MDEASKQILELALKLNNMAFGSGMEATITNMLIASERLLYGEDANDNGRIEPVTGEGGADTAYVYAYTLADMPILPGPKRTPPPGKKTEP
jgi:hypothetical protein